MALLYRGVYCVKHSRIESLEERVNILVFAHGLLLAYAYFTHLYLFNYLFPTTTALLFTYIKKLVILVLTILEH